MQRILLPIALASIVWLGGVPADLHAQLAGSSTQHGATAPAGYIDVKADFGAVGDGTADDTAALNAALSQAAARSLPLFLPPGIYKFTSALAPVIGDSIRIQGAGDLSVLEYAGANPKPGDLLVFGDGTRRHLHLSLRDFTIGSATGLSAGAAIRIRKYVGVEFDLAINGRLGHQGQLWDGAWFDGTSTINLHSSRFYVRSAGVIANDGSELHVNHAWIGGALVDGHGTGVGIHVGGGYGGVYTENVTQQNNDIGLLVDTALSKAGNMQFFLGGTFDTNKTAGCYFNDSSKNPISKVIYANAWFASSTMGSGCILAAWQGGTFISSTGTFKNNREHGLVLDDPTVRVVLGPTTDISDNRSYGVQAGSPLRIRSSAVPVDNVGGSYGTQVQPY